MANIKIIKLQGTLPGKNVVILAGVHGNEVCGVKAFDELIPQLKIKFGSVFLIYSNIEAIKQGKRFIDYNLNRCFLKKQSEEIKCALEGKTAKEIMPYLDGADAMLDIHASGTPDSIPFVICDKIWIKEGSMFDVDIVSFNWDKFQSGSTDYYMNLRKKPGFCVECGYLGDERSTDIAKLAINNFLVRTGNIEGSVVKYQNQKILKITGIYRNKIGPFKKSRDFKDFEELEVITLLGRDGGKGVYSDRGQVVLFMRDRDKLNEECFLTAIWFEFS